MRQAWDVGASDFGVNWSEILRKGGVPEPPGYVETVARVRSKPKRQRKKPKDKKSKKTQ